MYDMLVLGCDGFDNGLRNILESERVQKVVENAFFAYKLFVFIH